MTLPEGQPSQHQMLQCTDLLHFIQVLATGNQAMPQSLFYSVSANNSVTSFPQILERGPHFCFSWYVKGSMALYYIFYSSSIPDVSKAPPPTCGPSVGGSQRLQQEQGFSCLIFCIRLSVLKLPSTGTVKKQVLWKSI